MRALTPARLAHAAQVSPLPLSRRPNILSPTTLWAPGIAFAVASACSVWSRDQGFAMSGQARRATPPKRVRYPTGCSFASGCSPPRLATTQLPSATCVTTSHRLDFHLPDKTTSRTHPPRQSRGNSQDIRGAPFVASGPSNASPGECGEYKSRRRRGACARMRTDHGDMTAPPLAQGIARADLVDQ